MRPLRILIAEGNPPAMRERHAAQSGRTPSEFYGDVLSGVAEGLGETLAIDLCFPADEGANLPSGEDLAGYDGVAITGSGLNLWKQERESLAQVTFARAVFGSQSPNTARRSTR